jgi:hypothetical protein
MQYNAHILSIFSDMVYEQSHKREDSNLKLEFQFSLPISQVTKGPFGSAFLKK